MITFDRESAAPTSSLQGTMDGEDASSLASLGQMVETASVDRRHLAITAHKIPVESGIPIPPKQKGRRSGRFQRPRYPWRFMAVGQSFVWPCDNVLTGRVHAGSAVAARMKNTGEQYEVRVMSDGNTRVVRVWRVA